MVSQKKADGEREARTMPTTGSPADRNSEGHRRNAEAMRAVVAQLSARHDAVMAGGSAEARARHKARGKLLARERIDLLLDPGSPFLELSARRDRAAGQSPA